MKAACALICVGFLFGCGGGNNAGSGGAGGDGSSSASTSTSTSSSGSGGPQGGACDDPVSPDPDIKQALPQRFVDTSLPAATGKTIPVAAGGDLQQAIDAAQPGDVITLAAGASFTGPFTLPNKPGSGYIVVRTDTPDASFPAPGTRVGPGDASKMAKLITSTSKAVIHASPGAHHFRFVGVEITPTDASVMVYSLVELGDGSAVTMGEVPHHLIIDRSYVHGTTAGTVKQGVEVDCADCAVIDSYVSDCHAVGEDTQAILGYDGPGPIKIVNNYLEGSGENVMFGGVDPAIPDLVPSDIEIRGNHFKKPLTWKVNDPTYAGTHWSIKNHIQLKNAARVLVRCNVFENTWADDQEGFAIQLTPRNQGTATWSIVSDVTIVDNIIRHCSSGINVVGDDDTNPSQTTARLVIKGNVLHDLDRAKFGGDGRIYQLLTSSKPTQGVKIEHNTAFVSGDAAVVMGDTTAVVSGFIFRNNIAAHGDMGVFGAAHGQGTTALDFYAPGHVFTSNVLIGYMQGAYPVGNFFPATAADVGFMDYAGGDYRLGASSMFKGKGSDGKDIGADVADVNKRIMGVAP